MTKPKTGPKTQQKLLLAKRHLVKLTKSVNSLTKQINSNKPKNNSVNFELVNAIQALRDLSEELQTSVEVRYKPRIGFIL